MCRKRADYAISLFHMCFCSFAVYLWLGFGKLLDNLAGFI